MAEELIGYARCSTVLQPTPKADATARVKANATARIKATADRIKHAVATRDAAIAAAREKEAHVRAEAEEEIRRAHAEPKQKPAGAQKVRRWEAAAHFTRGEAVAERASWLRIWTRRRPVPAKLTVSLTEPPADRAAEPERVSVKAHATARIKDAADRIKVAAATRDAAIAAARAEEARVRARAQEKIKQARDAAEPLGARGKPAGRAKQRATSIAGGHDAAIAAKARAASAKKALRRVSAKAERRINAATQARDEAASVVADLKQERARARARGKASAKKALRRAKARRRKAKKALRQALAAAADLEQVAGWRRFTQWTIKLRALNGRARRHFWGPWGEWCQTVGHNQRLWKTALGKYDLARVPLGSSQDEADQVLLEVMYRAHDLNNGTLSRRADLLRFASLFVLAFVITLGSGYRATSSPTRGG